MHTHNRRTVYTALVVALALVFLLVMATAAFACPRGFEPSQAVLDCIHRHEGTPLPTEPGQRWDPIRRTYRGYATKYQMDYRFARSYSAPIPAEVWAFYGSDPGAPPWTWDPAIQDEVARNGVRARGLQPWPPARRRC